MLRLYENIKRYRKEAKMSQAELAQRTGYTDRSSIAKIEKGLVDLSQSKIKQFAEVLGVTPGHLMGWDEKPAEDLQDMGALAAELIMDQDAMEMVRQYMAMSESDRQAVRKFMALSEVDRFALQLVMASMGAKEKTTGAEAPAVEVLPVDVE
jgi:transcriptional regulator with XRE-family HTH domain